MKNEIYLFGVTCLFALCLVSCGSEKEKISFPVAYKGTYNVTVRKKFTILPAFVAWDCARSSSTEEATLTLNVSKVMTFEAPKDYIVSLVDPELTTYDYGWGDSHNGVVVCVNYYKPSLFSSEHEAFTGSHDGAKSFNFVRTQWACPKQDVKPYVYPNYTVTGAFTGQDASFHISNKCAKSSYVDGAESDRSEYFIEVSFTGTAVKQVELHP